MVSGPHIVHQLGVHPLFAGHCLPQLMIEKLTGIGNGYGTEIGKVIGTDIEKGIGTETGTGKG